MPSSSDGFTIGVEEEYLIIDPVTRGFSAEALSLLDKARHTLGEQVQPEVLLSQIEIITPVCVENCLQLPLREEKLEILFP